MSQPVSEKRMREVFRHFFGCFHECKNCPDNIECEHSTFKWLQEAQI